MMVRALLQVVAALREGIAEIEKAIEAVATVHPDFPIFASFPGAGPTMAPRLLAAFGSLRERFGSAHEVQTFSGIAPVIARSGETQFWIHFRWACPKFMRQTFHEFAALSIPHCEWARQFYERQKSRKKGHHAAVRALAFKWIRILFRCWQTATPYQEDLYLRAVEKRGHTGDQQLCTNPPLSSAAVTPSQTSSGPAVILSCGSTVELQLKNVAGFWKICAAKA